MRRFLTLRTLRTGSHCTRFLSGHKHTEERRVPTSSTGIHKPPVGQKPAFLQPLASRSVRHGEVARFQALVSGSPRPEVSWFHEQRPLRPSSNVVFHFDEATRAAVLIVVDAFPEHAGLYTCRAANAAGEASCSATLSVTAEEGEEGNSWIRRLKTAL